MPNEAVHYVGQRVCMKDEELLGIFNNFNRPGKAFVTDTYAGVGICGNLFEDKPGKHAPKAGVYAAAGVGYARAEYSIFDAEAKGPNVSAGAGLSTGHGARAFANAGLASASAAAGPLKAKVGLAVDTGVGISLSGVEVRMLGTGVTFGGTIGIYFLGNSFEITLI